MVTFTLSSVKPSLSFPLTINVKKNQLHSILLPIKSMRKEGRNRVIMLNIFMSSSTVNWHIIPVVSMLLGGGSLFCYNKFVTVFEILSTF